MPVIKNKMLIGFTHTSSAVLPRFFCRIFRHSAVVIDGVLIQIATDGVRCFPVGPREIRRLENAGWVFIKCNLQSAKFNCNLHFANCTFLTCVGFAKRAAGIRAPFIWTPDQLFRKLCAVSGDGRGYIVERGIERQRGLECDSREARRHTAFLRPEQSRVRADRNNRDARGFADKQ